MIPGYQFDQFKEHSAIKHLVTTIHGGVSEGNYASLNLSYQSGDMAEQVSVNRERVRQAFHSEAKLVLPKQVHGHHVVKVTLENLGVSSFEADALMTTEKNLIIGVLAADCVPMIFYDTVKGAIAVAHAGWRGTVQKIAIVVVQELVARFGCQPANIHVGIGPSISAANYEVGSEVRSAVENTFPDFGARFIQTTDHKHAHIDLPGLNNAQLIDSGVLPNHIESCGICTFDSPGQFFSARRQGFHSGRFGAFIMLNGESS